MIILTLELIKYKNNISIIISLYLIFYCIIMFYIYQSDKYILLYQNVLYLSNNKFFLRIKFIL